MLLLSVAWLVLLCAVNSCLEQKIDFILPFALPVVAVAWVLGLPAAFLVAALSALSAVAGGSIRDGSDGIELAVKVLFAYLKLSAIGFGAWLGIQRKHAAG